MGDWLTVPTPGAKPPVGMTGSVRPDGSVVIGSRVFSPSEVAAIHANNLAQPQPVSPEHVESVTPQT
jgi:hypothetical protein